MSIITSVIIRRFPCEQLTVLETGDGGLVQGRIDCVKACLVLLFHCSSSDVTFCCRSRKGLGVYYDNELLAGDALMEITP